MSNGLISDVFIRNIFTFFRKIFAYALREFDEKEFFEDENSDPVKTNELLQAIKGLTSEQLDHLIALAKGLHR